MVRTIHLIFPFFVVRRKTIVKAIIFYVLIWVLSVSIAMTTTNDNKFYIQSDPDLPGPDLPEPRFTGRIIFPRNSKLIVFDPDIPGTPIYRAKPFTPSIPVNRGPTVIVLHLSPLHPTPTHTLFPFQDEGPAPGPGG
eukprot:sb/3474506/